MGARFGELELFAAGHAANLVLPARPTARVVRPGGARAPEADPPGFAALTPGEVGTPALPLDVAMPASAVDELALVAVMRCISPGVYQLLSLRSLGAGPLRTRRAGPKRAPAAYYATPQRARRAGMRHLGVLVWRLEGYGLPYGCRLEGYGLPDACAEAEP